MPNFSTKVPIICLESETFKVLVKELAIEIRDEEQDPWIDEKETMRLLRISSKTAFQKYRDGGLATSPPHHLEFTKSRFSNTWHAKACLSGTSSGSETKNLAWTTVVLAFMIRILGGF